MDVHIKRNIKVAALAFKMAFGLTSASLAQSLPPENAAPGTCYAKVLIPAVYQTAPEEVLVQPEQVKSKTVPAVYRDVEKQVLVEEESYELIVVPASYETVTGTIELQPQQVIKKVVPAVYKEETEQVMISPARVEWKPGRGPHEKIDEATGEIMCRVEIPAKFETVTKQVMISPAKTVDEVVPPVLETVERRVMRTPPTTQKKIIPAKYKTVVIKELVQPAQVQEERIPPVYTTVERRQLVSRESVQWREILCETNTTKELVLELQKRLVDAGFSIGTTPNGNFGPATKAAIKAYQKAKGLPIGGLTISVLENLGMRSS